jgi:DnaJ-class molecular chaperone
MKNIKEKKCKNCKGRGLVIISEGMKGLTQCPVCLGSGIIKKDSEVEK